MIAEATRRSTPAEDHLARVRIARTLALAAPDQPPAGDRPIARPGDSNVAAAARYRRCGCSTAVGPLDTETLLEAIDRSRRFRDRTPFSASGSRGGAAAVGCCPRRDGRWHAPTRTFGSPTGTG